MKRIIITALFVAGSFGFANAQAKQTKPSVKKASHTTTAVAAAPKTVTAASKTVTATPVVKTKATTTVAAKSSGLKKDGTPDMRYKTNKAKTK